VSSAVRHTDRQKYGDTQTYRHKYKYMQTWVILLNLVHTINLQFLAIF